MLDLAVFAIDPIQRDLITTIISLPSSSSSLAQARHRRLEAPDLMHSTNLEFFKGRYHFLVSHLRGLGDGVSTVGIQDLMIVK